MRRLLVLVVLPAAMLGCRSILRYSPLANWERSQVYQPVLYPEGDWYPAGLAFEDAWFTAEDGTRLHGWYVAHENPRAVVLFSHGNAGNLSHRADVLRTLHDRHGLTVLIFDYRGYGRSEGQPGEEGLLMDARAAREWLARRANVAEGDIVLMGRSLGGAVAVDLAARDGARGLVLWSTFTSLADVAAQFVPGLPALFVTQNRFDSLSKISEYTGPLLVCHGDADELVPAEMGRRLYDAHSGPKQFVTIAGGRHNTEPTDEFHEALDQFIESLPEAEPAGSASTATSEG